jgi:hypothetical protein
MKLDRLETHDRLLWLKKSQSEIVSEGCEECLKRNSLSLAIQEKIPYVYIFLHARTFGLDEKITMFQKDFIEYQTNPKYKRKYHSMEEVPEKKLIWQPRMRKPEPQSNSQLFRAKSHSDELEVVWMIPDRALWDQFLKGKITESNIIQWSINQYRHNKAALAADHPEDITKEHADKLLLHIAQELEESAKQKKLKIKEINETY